MKAFTVKYGAGHSYQESWETTEYFCPNCGRRDVWHETSGGDYYVGELHLCRSCKHGFHLPNGTQPANDWQDRQRFDALGAPDTALR
jgi:hypothetical protein